MAEMLVQKLDIVTPQEMEERLARLVAEEREGAAAAITALAEAHAEQMRLVREKLTALAGRVPQDQSAAVAAIAERMDAAERKLSSQGGRIKTLEDRLRAANVP